MWLNLVCLFYALNMLARNSVGLRVIELSKSDFIHDPASGYETRPSFQNNEKKHDPDNSQESLSDAKISDNNIAPIPSESKPTTENRRTGRHVRAKDCDDPKEKALKDKIDRLIEQTINDAERKMSTIAEVKERGKEQAPYKIGFILNMVKKSREVQNELFNVAVKHRDDWKSLEQMKIFELMVHTNVDTTNLVRQMVEIHVQHSNLSHIPYERKRVVLLRRSVERTTPDPESKNIDIKKNYEYNKVPLTGRRWHDLPFKASLPPLPASLTRGNDDRNGDDGVKPESQPTS